MTDPNVAPPLFTAAGGESNLPSVALRGDAGNLNLDDIFGDVVFTPDGDTVFLSEQTEDGDVMGSGEGQNVKMGASRPTAHGSYAAVPKAGGLATTQLGRDGLPALAMGSADGVAPTKHVPFRHNPQAGHHLQYAAPKKKKSSRGMSESQKSERR